MEIQKYFGHLVTLTLLVLAGVHKDTGLAFAAVCSLVGIFIKESVSLYLQTKVPVVQPGIPEEVRRTIHDINARVATLEYGVKQRGF
jgi:hypothetical protein